MSTLVAKPSSAPHGPVRQVKNYLAYLTYPKFLGLLLAFIILGIAGAATLILYLGDKGPLILLDSYVGSDLQLSLSLGIGGIFVAIIAALFCWLSAVTSVGPLSPPDPKILSDHSASTVATVEPPELNLHGILVTEFEYARETAAQANEERRTVFNFYLLIIGGAGSGVIGLLSTISKNSELLFGASALLWIVCVFGLLTLFSIIALRLAWAGSATAMSYIKEFYLGNADDMEISRDILQSAFFFRSRTLPSAGKHWNTNHFTALMVALLNAAAFWGSVILLGVALGVSNIGSLVAGGGVLSIILFVGHWWAYDIALAPAPMRTVPAR